MRSEYDEYKQTYTLTLTGKELFGGEQWIKEHKGVPVTDTPLWVLISLGVLGLQRGEKDE